MSDNTEKGALYYYEDLSLRTAIICYIYGPYFTDMDRQLMESVGFICGTIIDSPEYSRMAEQLREHIK